MNDTELKELDQWIAKHVMGEKLMFGVKKRGMWYRPDAHGYTDRQSEAWRLTFDEAKKHEYLRGSADERVTVCEILTPRYSTEPAAAMQVLEKCGEKLGGAIVAIQRMDAPYEPGWVVNGSYAPTLPLAIALFAKQLFSQP